MKSSDLIVGKKYQIQSKDGYIIGEYIGDWYNRYRFNYLVDGFSYELKLIYEDLKDVKEL